MQYSAIVAGFPTEKKEGKGAGNVDQQAGKLQQPGPTIKHKRSPNSLGRQDGNPHQTPCDYLSGPPSCQVMKN